MFEDEARFGRMSNPLRCWAPSGCRPEVPTHRVREYTHFFGSGSPQDGEIIMLILPHADTAAMSLYLAEVSRRHPDEHILMFMDRAGSHQAKALVVPDNLTVDWLPPYSPSLNLIERLWGHLKRTILANVLYRSLDDLVAAFHDGVASLNGNRDAMGFLFKHDQLTRTFATNLARKAA